ncbi:MAG: lysophospholipid acyltransferase family protein [Bacteroidetes bacterium]|nr:lysophospholipid acyltransferase family protein [Bacteroidota bacterium]
MQLFIEYLLFQLLRLIILALPLKWVQRLGVKLADFAFIALTKRRSIAVENLQHAFPEKTQEELEQIARNAFRNLGISICEFLWFPNLTPNILKKIVEHKNINLMIDGHKSGKGMIMLSGHFGNWELIALASAYVSQIPFTIIVKTQKNTLVDKVINHHRTIFGNKVIAMEFAVREILSTLKNGGIVAMVADQSAPKESVFVPFFGRDVATYQGPAIFALRSGAPVQMGIIIRKPDFTYDVIIEEIDTSDISEYNEANVLELTKRHTAVLEKYIRLYPDHWMWTHRRWKNIKKNSAKNILRETS